MPTEVTIKTYTFAELSESPWGTVQHGQTPKDRAADHIRESFSDFTVEDVSTLFETELEQRGLHGLVNAQSPAWSLGHVQGDGVSFSGTIDLGAITPIIGDEGHGDQAADEGHIAAIRTALSDVPTDDVSVTVTRHGNYTHEYSMDAEIEYHGEYRGAVTEENYERWEDAVRVAIEAWLTDLSRRLSRMGYLELEYRDSEEAITELCDANNFLFDETGRRVDHLFGVEDQARDPEEWKAMKERLEYLRGEIHAERISYGEIAELQGLVKYIDRDDVELLEWAGVPENRRPRA